MSNNSIAAGRFAVLSCALFLLTTGSPACAQSPDLAAIQQAVRESLRNSMCPAPDRPPPDYKGMVDTDRQRMPPERIFDNLYLLGMKTDTAWALVTSEGIILFDAMFHYNVAETVVASLRRLGLDPADIRYVVVSHAHNDHFGGARYLQQEFGARIVMSVEDWEHMHTWPQIGSLAPFPAYDIAVRDGYRITLGDTTVDFVVTPGHTPGTLSSIFPVKDGDDVHYVGYWGGSAVSFLSAGDIVRYMASADRFARIDPRVDVPMANHPSIDGALVKLAALKVRDSGDPHPFVAGNDGFKAWMSAVHDCAGEVLERKLQPETR